MEGMQNSEVKNRRKSKRRIFWLDIKKKKKRKLKRKNEIEGKLKDE